MNSLPRPRPSLLHFDAATMQCHEALHQREPDAEAAFGAIDGRVHLREHREQAGDGFGLEADAVVADGNDQLGIGRRGRSA